MAPRAEAKCGYPVVQLSLSQGERGAALTVTGQGFWGTCNDDGPPETLRPGPAPAKGIQLVFKQNGKAAVLATVDADASLGFSTRVTIPRDAVIGKASILADASLPWGTPMNGVKPYEAPFEVIASSR